MQNKHPEDYSSPEEVKKDIQFVLTAPDFVSRGNVKSNIIVDKSDKNKNIRVAIRIVIKGGRYHIRSVHRISDAQYEKDKKNQLSFSDSFASSDERRSQAGSSNNIQSDNENVKFSVDDKKEKSGASEESSLSSTEMPNGSDQHRGVRLTSKDNIQVDRENIKFSIDTPGKRKLAGLIEKFKQELNGVDLNSEQQDVYDVVTGKVKNARLRRKDLNSLKYYVLHWGSRGKGIKKIIQVHYGDGARNMVTADEIINIGEVIRNGQYIPENDPKHPESHRYEMTTGDGARLRVVIDLDKKNNESVINFYSDRKPETRGNNTASPRKITDSSKDNIQSDNENVKFSVDDKKQDKEKSFREWKSDRHPLAAMIEEYSPNGIRPDKKYGNRETVTGSYINWGKDGTPSDVAAAALGMEEQELIDSLNGLQKSKMRDAYRNETGQTEKLWREEDIEATKQMVLDDQLEVSRELLKKYPELEDFFGELLTGKEDFGIKDVMAARIVARNSTGETKERMFEQFHLLNDILWSRTKGKDQAELTMVENKKAGMRQFRLFEFFLRYTAIRLTDLFFYNGLGRSLLF